MQPRTEPHVHRRELELWTLDDAESWNEAELSFDSDTWMEDDPLLDNDLWMEADCGDVLSPESLGRLGIRIS